MAGPTEKPSVFVDADVLIAGSASTSGASHLILQLGELGLIDVVSSAQARTEAECNIARKLPAALPAFRVLSSEACRWVDDPATEPDGVGAKTHPKDRAILGAAILAGCSSLITFNTRDFHPTRGAITVETPGAFVERLRAIMQELGEPRRP